MTQANAGRSTAGYVFLRRAIKMILVNENLKSDVVQSIELKVSEAHLSVCNIQEPATGLETKVSLRHCAALTLAGKITSAIRTLSDRSANNPKLIQQRQKVRLNGCRPLGLNADVETIIRNARKSAASRDARLPEASLETQEEKLINKFENLSKTHLGERRRAMSNQLLRFDRLKAVYGVLSDTVGHHIMASTNCTMKEKPAGRGSIPSDANSSPTALFGRAEVCFASICGHTMYARGAMSGYKI